MTRPPIHGGQGRTPDDLRDTARVLAWIAAAVVLLASSFTLRWWLS